MGVQQQVRSEIAAAVRRERLRIAQVFHNTVCQSFSGIHFMTDVLLREPQESPKSSSQLEELALHLRQATNDLYSISQWLIPPDFPPGAAITDAFDRLTNSVQKFIPCEFRCSIAPTAIDPIKARGLVHIAHETAWALLCRKDVEGLVFQLSDVNGNLGFSIKIEGLGLHESENHPFVPEWEILQYEAHLIDASLTITSKDCTIHVAFAH